MGFASAGLVPRWETLREIRPIPRRLQFRVGEWIVRLLRSSQVFFQWCRALRPRHRCPIVSRTLGDLRLFVAERPCARTAESSTEANGSPISSGLALDGVREFRAGGRAIRRSLAPCERFRNGTRWAISSSGHRTSAASSRGRQRGLKILAGIELLVTALRLEDRGCLEALAALSRNAGTARHLDRPGHEVFRSKEVAVCRAVGHGVRGAFRCAGVPAAPPGARSGLVIVVWPCGVPGGRRDAVRHSFMYRTGNVPAWRGPPPFRI